MISGDDENGVDEREDGHGYARMTAIIEERKERFVKPTERADAEDYMEQNECCDGEGAYEKDFVGNERVMKLGGDGKDKEDEADGAEEGGVVDSLLAIPLNGFVFDGHRLALAPGNI